MVARKKDNSLALWLERSASAVTRWTGSTSAFILACGIVLVWALIGPIFQFGDTLAPSIPAPPSSRS